MGGFRMQHYRNLHIIWSLLRSPMVALIINWMKVTAIAVAEVAKIAIPALVIVYINYGLSRRISHNGTEEEKFIGNIVLAIVFSVVQIGFVYAIHTLVQHEEIQLFKSYVTSKYDNIKKAYFESKVKLEKDMREFDIEAQTLINKDN